MRITLSLFMLIVFMCLPSFAVASQEELPEIVLVNQPTVPDGAIHIGEKIFRKAPPANQGYDYAVFWYQIATLSQEKAKNKQNSGIILQSCSITGKNSSGKVIVEEKYEGDTTLGSESGGLYSRNPNWFDSDNHTPIVQQMLTKVGLVINASSTPDKVVHWWSPRFPYDANLKYQLEMKVKVVGDVALQIGGDYWKGDTSPHNGWAKDCAGKNNCEAFVSQWYGDTDGKFVTITKDI